MDNVAVVVDELEAAIAFFADLGLERDGGTTVEGPWVDGCVGLTGVRSEIFMMRTPDGLTKLELTKYHAPDAVSVPAPPANTIGLHRLMFAVDDLEATLERLRPHGAEVLGEVTRYEDAFLLCYLRGPAGIIVALAEELP